ncbi:uncharacterized protein LOC121590496 isoform X2 [Anopheles merus]|uniref:uncharacterized protein LOC121589978 isoform X2 n=1 Tax=Anopheles merus TaxID=30066 RepID=UPI001BE3F695|nr:uncharacterized protein LOC121589978 isoform X2 [Anopheles merus]XP_041766171.1 uncharacterized protein LOC121590496 isoform X2 [Anopheles merus]
MKKDSNEKKVSVINKLCGKNRHLQALRKSGVLYRRAAKLLKQYKESVEDIVKVVSPSELQDQKGILIRSHLNQLRARHESTSDEGDIDEGRQDQLSLDVLLDEFNLPKLDRGPDTQADSEATSQRPATGVTAAQPAPSQIPVRQRSSHGRTIRLPARFQPYVLS